ncbi:ASCH domain-containing protein [Lacticaseibacillus sp. GG6-2]
MNPIDTFFQTAKQELALDPTLHYQRVITDIDDSEQLLAGKLTALTSGFELYMHNHLPLPEAHDINVVVDPNQQPLALTYTEEVLISPFATLDATHALAEGAADFDQWREAKIATLTSAYQAAELRFDPKSAMVVIERFRVLYPFD